MSFHNNIYLLDLKEILKEMISLIDRFDRVYPDTIEQIPERVNDEQFLMKIRYYLFHQKSFLMDVYHKVIREFPLIDHYLQWVQDFFE